MTTIENAATEKRNGSAGGKITAESPWWNVRPSLAASLAGSFAVAAAVFHFVGTPMSGAAMPVRSMEGLMRALSSTPSLIAFAVIACALMIRRQTRRTVRTLAALLALAAVAGAGINATRDSHGRGPVENWVENALADVTTHVAAK